MGRLRFALSCALIPLAACCLSACAAPALAPVATIQPPQSLIGSTPAILAAEFGQPTLLRVEGPAQVWLYHSSACGLNLILYPDSHGVPRVAMATADDGGPALSTCPILLQQAHIEGPATAALERPASS